MKKGVLWATLLALLLVLLTGCGDKSAIEDRSVPVMNNIIKESGSSIRCEKVKITETLDEKTYRGEAVMENGIKIPIAIAVSDDQVFVVLINE